VPPKVLTVKGKTKQEGMERTSSFGFRGALLFVRIKQERFCKTSFLTAKGSWQPKGVGEAEEMQDLPRLQIVHPVVLKRVKEVRNIGFDSN
jgi:aspartate carbamoyltransferase catalytic subunit